MKYGVLLNNTYNIGDDLQSVASAQFLPSVDYYAFKEQLNKFKTDNGEKAKIILNSWYMWRPDNFPPSPDIDPLLVSMHFCEECRNKILTEETQKWLKENGPVGCRDDSTKQWLIDNGIPAYFSGCLTITLTGNDCLRKNDSFGGYILCVDVSDEVMETVKKRTNRPVFRLSKWIFSNFYAKDRLEISKMFLYMYHQAAAVVTGNMHTSLPSLGMNTPVCLIIDENKGFHAETRFSGLLEFFNHYSTNEFLEKNVYNFDNPPSNPMTHLSYREKLIDTCKNFTGFYNNEPVLANDFNSSIELLKLLQYCEWKSDKDYKGLVSIPNKKRIMRVGIKRYMGLDKHDLIQY